MEIHVLSDIYKKCVNNAWNGKIIEQISQNILNNSIINKYFSSLDNEIKSYDINFGDRVIVKTSNTIEIIVLMIYLWNKGIVIIPVKDNTIEAVIEEIGIDSNSKFVTYYKEGKLFIKALESYKISNNRFITKSKRNISGSDLALIIYTSGSTGKQKGVLLTHNNVTCALRSIIDYINIHSNDTILCISPLSFDYGLYQILFAFKTDCTVILCNKDINPIEISNAIKEYSVTITQFVPATASSFERTLHLYKNNLTSLRKITNTGGHLQEKTIRGIREKLSFVEIYAMYGLTESKRALYLPPKDIDRKIGSVGIPMPGLEAKIFQIIKNDHSLDSYIETEPFEVGILFVRGPSVMQTYSNSISNNDVYIIGGQYRDDNWLCTGDLFYRDDEGYLYFKGRAKELIKQAGYCLYPKDIEDIVNQNVNVYYSIALAEQDQDGNEIAHLFICLENDETTIREEVSSWLKEQISREYLPRKITFLSNIPLTNNGKIDKKKIIALYQQTEV